jgi:hypothetical protein
MNELHLFNQTFRDLICSLEWSVGENKMDATLKIPLLVYCFKQRKWFSSEHFLLLVTRKNVFCNEMIWKVPSMNKFLASFEDIENGLSPTVLLNRNEIFGYE